MPPILIALCGFAGLLAVLFGFSFGKHHYGNYLTINRSIIPGDPITVVGKLVRKKGRLHLARHSLASLFFSRSKASKAASTEMTKGVVELVAAAIGIAMTAYAYVTLF